MTFTSFSEPFIRRPVGTTLLAIGLLLVGVVAYRFLPVASMPTVDFPTITVNATRPGADPETMAATVAAPLERRLGEIAGVTELTSRSSLGSTRVTIQFDLARNIDGAARDVQAAINAALTDLPADLPSSPSFHKSNPAATPIMILALTSNTVPPSVLYDAADSVIAQRLSQIEGVAEVTVSGAEQPAIRVRVDPIALASMGLALEDVRTAIVNTNAVGPLGVFSGTERAITITANDQLRTAADYEPIVVRAANAAVVRMSAVASIELGVRDRRGAAWFNGQPSVLLVIKKQANSNVIEMVDRIYKLLPEIKRWIPTGIDISVLSDRSRTIRSSVFDMQLTLIATVILVMLVVFVFLRRAATTIAAGITVPLALAGTFAMMWVAGFSIDNLSLIGPLPHVQAGTIRALAIATGKRNALLPDVPTAAEEGLPQFDAAPFYAIFAPKGTPQTIVYRLADALNKGLNEDLARKRLLDLGAEIPEPNRRGPKPLGALVKSEIARLTPIIQAASAN
jgi:multidrug efflux pump subunit AcrB